MVSAESSNHSTQTQFPRELNLEKVCSTFDNKTVISARFKEMRITGNKKCHLSTTSEKSTTSVRSLTEMLISLTDKCIW